MTEQNQVDPLLSALRDDNESLRDHAASRLGQVGAEAIPKLIDMFLEDDCVIREAATSALVQIGEPAIDPLIEALKDDDEWSVREQAANALGKLRAHKSVEPLVHALKHDKDGGVKTAAIWALERIGHPDAVPGLIEALMDATLREDAARVLKKLGDSRATTALVEGLHASNWIVRRHALKRWEKSVTLSRWIR